MVRFSPSQTRQYLQRAQDAVSELSPSGESFEAALDHIVGSYLQLPEIARSELHFLLCNLPLHPELPQIHNAFVSRRLLIDAHRVLLRHVLLAQDLCASTWDHEHEEDERDFDVEIMRSAKEQDAHVLREWNVRSSSVHSIQKIVDEENATPGFTPTARHPGHVRSQWPLVDAMERLSHRCLQELHPLTRSWLCKNPVYISMHQRVQELLKFAVELSYNAEDEQPLLSGSLA